MEEDPCRVFSRSGTLCAEGVILERVGDRMLLEVDRVPGVELEPGAVAQVEVLSPARGAIVHDAVVAVFEMRRMELVGVVVREVVQQRSAVRVPTQILVRITHTVDGDEREELTEPLDLEVRDVSAHGMRLVSEVRIEPGTQLVLPFEASGTSLELVLEVLRTVPEGDDHSHGCRLVGLGERETDALFRFVLDEQRRQLAERNARR